MFKPFIHFSSAIGAYINIITNKKKPSWSKADVAKLWDLFEEIGRLGETICTSAYIHKETASYWPEKSKNVSLSSTELKYTSGLSRKLWPV